MKRPREEEMMFTDDEDDEYDEDDDFIDNDTGQDDNSYTAHIRDIFGYDKRK